MLVIVIVSVAVAVLVTVWVGVLVAVGVRVVVLVRVTVGVPLAVDVMVRVRLGVGDGIISGVRVFVGVGSSVGVWEGGKVTVGVRTGVQVLVRVDVRMGVADATQGTSVGYQYRVSVGYGVEARIGAGTPAARVLVRTSVVVSGTVTASIVPSSGLKGGMDEGTKATVEVALGRGVLAIGEGTAAVSVGARSALSGLLSMNSATASGPSSVRTRGDALVITWTCSRFPKATNAAFFPWTPQMPSRQLTTMTESAAALARPGPYSNVANEPRTAATPAAVSTSRPPP